MYSDKKNILQLAALLKAYKISDIVLCPGSRNSPIIHTFANHPYFDCSSVTDERSAGFFAAGLALQKNKPVAVCCTSGTALLNLHPAVAEAFYQQIPLIVISADRPAAWIGQTDGQTLPQPNVFGPLVKRSVNLPEVTTDEEAWYCNRLINEALSETGRQGKGPVHINVPISEPLFQFTIKELPDARVITRHQGFDEKFPELISRLQTCSKCLMIAGQMPPGNLYDRSNAKLVPDNIVLLGEHLSNQDNTDALIKNFDSILYALSEEYQKDLVPEILITFGGHIVSKRLKKFLRTNPPREHWHISPDGEIVDLFCSLTNIIICQPVDFLNQINQIRSTDNDRKYLRLWKDYSNAISEPQFSYSEMSAIGALLNNLPENSVVHLGNSSSVRYAQLFSVPNPTVILCNRGTSGIEGSLSTAVGYASASNKPNFVVIGDLSFFYDMNALWNDRIKSNLRILLLNNGGGEIFQSLPGFDMTEQTRYFVTGTHATSAKGWAIERGFHYSNARNETELQKAIQPFTRPEQYDKPMLLEIFTDKAEDIKLLKEYYHKIKLKIKS